MNEDDKYLKDYPPLPTKGAILVCDVCLKELVLPNGEVTEETLKWDIPSLTMIVRTLKCNKQQVRKPASDIKCYCPKHKKNN